MNKLIAVTSVLALAACQPTTESATGNEPLQPTLANIQTLIGKPVAKNINACRLLEVGEKACGGPERYLVYSTESVVSEAQLLKLVREYNQRSSKQTKNQYSTCDVTPRPEVTLVNGVCRASR